MKVFYTSGSDDHFPFYGGWVEIEVESMKQACRGVKKRLPLGIGTGVRAWGEFGVKSCEKPPQAADRYEDDETETQ